jgi:signal transduction histidine kinase
VPSRAQDAAFSQFVSLACHDIRTPLATVTGFVRTLPRVVDADERASRCLALIDAAADQLAGLVDDLSVVARIESGRYDPPLVEVDALELARVAAERTTDGVVDVSGRGERVLVEPDGIIRALAHLARCVLRHGALERVTVEVDGPGLALSPVSADVAPIVLGEDLRDMGAAVAVRVVAALGGSSAVEGERLLVRLPRP